MQGFITGFGSRPMCANDPDAPGLMRPTPIGRTCRNYRPRPATPVGDVKTIPLGGGLHAYVDAADYEWLNRWAWHLRGGYAVRYEKGKLIFMHRQIMQPPQGMVVDHKNQNKLDNTRANLWVCTPGDNVRNRRKQIGTSSRFRGVSYGRACGKWIVAIWFEGRLIHAGHFTDEVEAAKAYDRKAVELLGEFARLNFPDEWPARRKRRIRVKRPCGKQARGRRVGRGSTRGGHHAGQ
jgi:hypothetical protein